MTTQLTDATQRTARRTGWWDTPFTMFQTNLREIDVTFDVDTALDDIQEHGANVWLLNVGGILSHYPTDLEFQTRNPMLAERASGDLIADAVTAAHARGVRLMARMDFSKVSPVIADAHPEWLFRSRTGENQVFEGLVSVCPSGLYYQERTLDILDEVIERYPVDGFFFNWFGFNEVDYGGTVHGVCHCTACVREFAAFTGIDALPADAADSSYLEWKRFTAHTIDSLTAKITRHIAERRPEAGLILGRSADILFHEANNGLGRTLWPHATSEAVSALRVAQPDKPVLVNAVAFFDMPYRLADEQPEMMAQYLGQAISRGANPSTYIMGAPGEIAYGGLAAAAFLTRLRRDSASVYTSLRPAADVALVRPDALTTDAARHAASITEFRGLYSSLLERHIPFDVLPADTIADATLEPFRLVILPDIAVLDDRQNAAIERYVVSGGRTLALAATGIRDDGTVSSWLPSRRQRSVESDIRAIKSSYVQLSDSPAVEGSVLVPRYGCVRSVLWKDTARLQHRIIEQAPYGPPEKAYGHVEGTEFACATLTVGRGRSAQVPWTIGTAYRETGLTRLRDAVVAVVDDLTGARQIDVTAAEQLEVVYGRSAEGIVIHLLNHSGQRRNGFGPAIPILNTHLRIPGAAGRAARSLVAPETVEMSNEGDDLVISVGRVEFLEVLVIEPDTVEAGDDRDLS